MKAELIAAVVALGALSACTTMQANAVSPDGKYFFDTGRCIRELSNSPTKRELVVYTGLPEKRMPEVVCRRFEKAMAQGRFTPGDFGRLQRGTGGHQIWKIARGQ